MKTTKKAEYQANQIEKYGLSLNIMTSYIQPAIGFYSAFSSITGDLTLNDIYIFVKSRENEYIEYIRKFF